MNERKSTNTMHDSYDTEATMAVQDNTTQITYMDAGVDITEGARAVDAIKEDVRSTYTAEVLGDLGGFGGLFSAAAFKNMSEPILVSGTDGVGTKLDLAKRLHKHSSIGIDLVAMCVNDIVTTGARPLFFLDYLAVGKLKADFAATVVKGIAEGCRQAGCALIGGEMAEHPGIMNSDDYDVSGFAVGVVDKPKMLGPDRVQIGDIIIGIASSGLHSNGYSLVRRALTDKLSNADLAKAVLPVSANEKPNSTCDRSLARALLAPTRIYVKPLLAALDAGLPIHAAAHITGGGITENLNRALQDGMRADIKNASSKPAWSVPAVIDAVIDAAGLSLQEAYKTFNMGIGMALIVDAQAAEAIREHFSAIYGNEEVFVLGEVTSTATADTKPQVIYL